MTEKIIVFLVLSVLLLVFTLRNAHRYRFHRFLAFEICILLVLVNISEWFRTPGSPLQIVSWILLTVSAILPVLGLISLKRYGKPRGGIENTTHLVTSGIYTYIRHPMYTSLLYCGLGALLKDIRPASFILFFCLIISVYMLARAEERENRYRFGRIYLTYEKSTKRFFPFLF